jgi:hypothetical protein
MGTIDMNRVAQFPPVFHVKESKQIRTEEIIQIIDGVGKSVVGQGSISSDPWKVYIVALDIVFCKESFVRCQLMP